jgi:hypothetical protein
MQSAFFSSTGASVGFLWFSVFIILMLRSIPVVWDWVLQWLVWGLSDSIYGFSYYVLTILVYDYGIDTMLINEYMLLVYGRSDMRLLGLSRSLIE